MNIKYIFKVLHGNIFISSFGLGLGLRDGSCRRCGILKPIDKYFQISRQIFSILSDKYVQIIRQICSILSYKYFHIVRQFCFHIIREIFSKCKNLSSNCQTNIFKLPAKYLDKYLSNYQTNIFNITIQVGSWTEG